MSLRMVAQRVQHEKRHPVCGVLEQVVEVALQLHTFTTQLERDLGQLAKVKAIDAKLERLSVKFDSAHTEALKQDVPMNNRFEVDCEGRRYSAVLTEDGLEFCPLS